MPITGPCPHFQPPASCAIVSDLAGEPTAGLTPAACAARPTPRAVNSVTVSLAVSHFRHDEAKAKELLRTHGHHLERIQPPAPIGHGPGTELKALLGLLGIHAAPDCQCNARAEEMDRNGPAWCRANLATITGWLREESQRRGLPFVAAGARLLVGHAIRRAEKKARHQQTQRPAAPPAAFSPAPAAQLADANATQEPTA